MQSCTSGIPEVVANKIAMTRRNLLALLSLTLALPCSAQRNPKPSFKGIELYSWQVDGRWIYVLLPGTNRNKSWPELQQARQLDGEGQLKDALSLLAVGESLFWMNQCQQGPKNRLQFPDSSVRQQLSEYCRQLKIELVLPANLTSNG